SPGAADYQLEFRRPTDGALLWAPAGLVSDSPRIPVVLRRHSTLAFVSDPIDRSLLRILDVARRRYLGVFTAPGLDLEPRAGLAEAATGETPGATLRRREAGIGHSDLASALSPDGRFFAAALDRVPPVIEVHDLADGRLVAVAKDAVQPAWSADGRLLAWFSRDPGRVPTANPGRPGEPATVTVARLAIPAPGVRLDHPAAQLLFSSDGREVMAGGERVLLPPRDGEPALQPAGSPSAGTLLQPTGNGDYWTAPSSVVTGARSVTIATASGVGDPLELPARPGITALAFAPDGDRLLAARVEILGTADEAAGRTNALEIWNLRRQQREAVWPAAAPGYPGAPPVFTPDGSKLACALFHPEGAEILDAATGERERRVFTAETGRTPEPGLLGALRAGAPVVEAPAHRLRALRFSSDGTRLLAGTAAGWVCSCTVASGRVRFAVPAHQGEVTALAVSHDDQWLATCSVDGTLRLARGSDGREVARWEVVGRRWIALEFSPDGRLLMAGSSEGSLQVWNVATGDPITPPFQAAGRLTRLAFSPDGERVLAVSAEPGSPTPPEVRVWQADSGKLLLSRPWPNPVLAAGFEGSGESVLIADPLALRRVGVASGKSETRVDYGPASHVALNQDATLLAVAPTNTNPPSVLVYDAATGQPLTKPLPTTNALSHLSFDPAGRLLIGVSTNGDVQLWKVPDGILISSGHVVEKGTSFEGLISPNGDRVLVSGVSSTWLFAATNLVEPIVRYPVHRVTTEAAFSPDGTRFLLVDGTEFRLFRAADGRPATEPVEVGWYVEDASFDATGVRIATVASQAQALIYDLRDGAAAPEKLSLPAGQRFQMLSDDGAWVTASTSSNTISVRSVDGWQPVGPELAHPGEASTLAIGSPPLRVATLSGPNEDGLELRIWEPATGRLIDQPIRLKFSPQRASFSPIGGHLALADPADSLLVTEVDGRLETWSFETAAGLPFDAQIGGGKVYVLRFSSDGKTLAIGTHGHGAQLWDVVRRQHRC
ncbi:MAG: PD40 domain-containing protein, partial [Verrucomicrobiae bacterium]|nr:PD40 domain-containing protein [Verrucomicrobiae bacterium]